MAGHEPDVRDAEVLEEPARLGEVDDRCAQPFAELANGRPDARDAGDQLVVLGLARLPGPGQLDLAQVRRESADRRADRHLVVVQHDQELGLALTDVVQRLEAEAARDRGVTDDDRDPLGTTAKISGRRETLSDREPGSRVAAGEPVVLGLAPTREAADATELAERLEPFVATGD